MSVEIDTAAVEAVGTETFPEMAGLFGNAAALVEHAQTDQAPAGLYDSTFLSGWVYYSNQLTLYMKQSEANLEVCGEMLADMAREMAAVDADNRDEIEASYSALINNPDSGSYGEATDLE